MTSNNKYFMYACIISIIIHKLLMILIPSILLEYAGEGTLSEAIVSAIFDPISILVACIVASYILIINMTIVKIFDKTFIVLIGIYSGACAISLYPAASVWDNFPDIFKVVDHLVFLGNAISWISTILITLFVFSLMFLIIACMYSISSKLLKKVTSRCHN